MLRTLHDQLVGETIEDKYQLTRHIGSGSFAVVYEASELFSGEHVGRVAVKLIDAHASGQQAGLIQEIRALAQLNHAHVLAYRTSGLVQSGRLEGVLYIVTELAGRSLSDLMLEGADPSTAKAVCLQISSALAHLHLRNAVHRDVKPANILRVDSEWKLSDFGLARAVSDTLATASGRKGTLAYMAPEMLDGQVGPASDVYALGVTLLECLTGRLAHEGSNEGEFMRNLMTIPAAIPPDLPEPWQMLLTRCLASDPAARCCADELAALMNVPQEAAYPVEGPQQSPRIEIPADPPPGVKLWERPGEHLAKRSRARRASLWCEGRDGAS
jgi:serine/threonine protein kinase